MNDIRSCDASLVQAMCEKYHGYKSAGKVFTYAFAVYENDQPVACFAWNPPPPGAAKSVCPEAPYAVLSLARMVAVPKNQRQLKHISKPLRRQMKHLIDRTRWPVLVTYSDEGQGHTGYVYKCSGFTKTTRSRRPVFVTPDGSRKSHYCAGKHTTEGRVRTEDTVIQRWEHRACDVGAEAETILRHWKREPIRGRKYSSGNQAYQWQKIKPTSGAQ